MDFGTVKFLGAEWVEPILPSWVGDLWKLPEVNKLLLDREHGKFFAV